MKSMKELFVGVVLAGALVTGCFGTANLVPSDSRISAEEAIHIHAGRGVLFQSLDGAQVRASEIVALPGPRNLRFDVRRGMRDLDDKKLEGIYQVGTCRVLIESLPGEHFEVFTRVFAEERFVVVEKRSDKKDAKEVFGVTVHVKNRTTGDVHRARPDACEFRIDCSKLDRMHARAGKECTF